MLYDLNGTQSPNRPSSTKTCQIIHSAELPLPKLPNQRDSQKSVLNQDDNLSEERDSTYEDQLFQSN